MNWEPVKKAITAIAPTVGTLLGGPLGGMVAGQLSTLLTGSKDATPKEMLQAFGSSNPDVFLQLQQLENDTKLQLEQMNIDLHKLQLDDVTNARQRQIELAKAGIKDWVPSIIALSVTFGFFLILILLLFVDAPEGTDKVMAMILGALSNSFGLVLAYYFGASIKDVLQKNSSIEDK